MNFFGPLPAAISRMISLVAVTATVAVDVDDAGAPIVRGVQDEAQFRLHRTAEIERQIAGHAFAAVAEVLKDARQLLVSGRTVDDETHRAVLAVADHENDGLMKPRVAHLRRRDQKLPGQELPLRRVDGGRRSPEQHRGRKQRRERHKQPQRTEHGHGFTAR